MSDFTNDELEAMTPEQRALAELADSYVDPDEGDERFGDLPYDDLVDPDGHPLT